MNINRFALLGALLATLVFSGAIHAADKFYKWTDAAGVVHYGENPPDPAKATRVNVRVGSATQDAEAEQEKAAVNAGSRVEAAKEDALDEAERANIAQENASIVEENCKIYRQNLSALQNSSRIRERDGKGEYRYLSEEEKSARIETAEKYIKENCQ